MTGTSSRSARAAEVALFGIAAVWGATFVLVQEAVAHLPVLTFLAYRFVPAALLVALFATSELRRLPVAGWRGGLAMGVFLTGGYVLQTFGLQRTTASNAGFITGLFVVLTPLFGALFFRQSVGRLVWVAAGVSALGLLLLSGAGSRVNVDGDLLVFLCACAFAFHILVTKRAVDRHPAGALVAVQLGVCGVVCLAAAAALGQLEIPRSGFIWFALAVTSLVASALGFLVQTFAQRRTTPARTALILASEPAFAGLFAYLLKGERLSAAGWLGAGLIMAAIIFVESLPYLGRSRRRQDFGGGPPETRRREVEPRSV